MAYFCISRGLRGCYTPDGAYVVKVNSRRELKAILEDEARDIRDAGFLGASKANVATHAAECWRRRADPRWTLDLVLPYRRADQPGNFCFGLFVSRATRADYLAYLESEGF
jgi:hypothetical protein